MLGRRRSMRSGGSRLAGGGAVWRARGVVRASADVTRGTGLRSLRAARAATRTRATTSCSTSSRGAASRRDTAGSATGSVTACVVGSRCRRVCPRAPRRRCRGSSTGRSLRERDAVTTLCSMAQTQAERARNYRKRKREERESLAASRGPVAPSRHVTRRAAQDEARADRVERATAILQQPLPPRGELLDEALRTLRSVALDAGAAEASRVGAGRAIVAWAAGPSGGTGRGASGSEGTQGGAPSSENGDGDPPRTPTLDDVFQ